MSERTGGQGQSGGEPHVTPRRRKRLVDPIPTHEPGAVHSDDHRRLVHEGTDPAPIRFTDTGPLEVQMSAVRAARVSWLWEGRIPLGMVTVVTGDPGVGKSTFIIDIAARVSTGSPMPGDGPASSPREPADVIVLTAEDPLAQVVRPRLEAHGGALERIYALQGIRTTGEKATTYIDRPPELPHDVADIAAVVTAHRAALVVIDVLNAYLGDNIDTHKDHSVRRALAPLSAMAQATGAAVVVLGHLTKNRGGPAIYAASGSIGVVGAARSVLLVGRDPKNEERRVVAVTKPNLAPLPPSLAFTVVPDEEHGCGRIAWERDPVALVADELVAMRPTVDADEQADRDEAVAFLQETLTVGLRVDSKDIKRRARAEGIKEPTLHRARRPAGVRIDREGRGKDHKSWWSIPPPTDVEPGDSLQLVYSSLGTDPYNECDELQRVGDETAAHDDAGDPF